MRDFRESGKIGEKWGKGAKLLSPSPGRQNEKVAILGIEADGRMHKHFHRLIDTFAKFKADADAGPHDDNTSPVDQVSPIGFFAHEVFSHGQDPGRAREVRGGTKRIMLITYLPAHQTLLEEADG